MPYTYPYPRPSVTVDAVVFGVSFENGRFTLRVLLMQRKAPPFRGQWALPGGFVHMKEGLDDAARRELYEETGVMPAYMEQLCTFGRPRRDPRGRVISIAYLALVKSTDHVPRAASDARAVEWRAIPSEGFGVECPKLAFDHRKILSIGRERLRAKVRYAPIGFDLLPDTFTLSELQALYELVLGRKVDRRNFRRKILRTGVLARTGALSRGQHPALLYRFDRDAYERLTNAGFSFDI